MHNITDVLYKANNSEITCAKEYWNLFQSANVGSIWKLWKWPHRETVIKNHRKGIKLKNCGNHCNWSQSVKVSYGTNQYSWYEYCKQKDPVILVKSKCIWCKNRLKVFGNKKDVNSKTSNLRYTEKYIHQISVKWDYVQCNTAAWLNNKLYYGNLNVQYFFDLWCTLQFLHIF